eukprot:CAMPEP_0195116500 /NCGR_PEP_ID=MMETSP0448-20130528/112072_1 /TAXON_ID=66468 /ORGANISM="Heterocapsa triquestra, Strain CCMP 448" /LENGTH=160 /DNA_ID=CAMNT_0040153665 /DNA_START=24 /DNA_END=506 /DNA_ORIENTATION=+
MVYGEILPKVRSYSVSLRPWAEFFVFERPDERFEFQSHIERNMSHFQANYLLIACTLVAVAIFMHPSWLVLVSLLVGGWALYMAKGGFDPDWKPVVGGVELTSAHRMMILGAGSLGLFFLVLGEALLVLAGALAMLTIVHAVFHPGPSKGAAIAVLQSMV